MITMIEKDFELWRKESIELSDIRVKKKFNTLLEVGTVGVENFDSGTMSTVGKTCITVVTIVTILCITFITYNLLTLETSSELNLYESKYLQVNFSLISVNKTITYNITNNITTTVIPSVVGECISVKPINSSSWDAKCHLT